MTTALEPSEKTLYEITKDVDMADTCTYDDEHGMFHQFIHSEVSGSIVLIFCTLVALVWANSPWGDSYFALAHTKIGISWGEHKFALSLQHWINDFLMAIFFFVVGLEIKREIVLGQLSTFRQAALPVMAAIGGMVVPAVLYFILNSGSEGARGWGIPMATDIAFALGVLAMFGKRAPLGLKVFLTALAIADDLGAVAVIAVFYTEKVLWLSLAISGLFLFLIRLADLLGIRNAGIYIILSLVVWLDIFFSGVHATVAGVLLAMLVPVRATIDPKEFVDRADTNLVHLRQTELTPASMVDNDEQLSSISELHRVAGDMIPPGLALEKALHPVQSFIILPLFALFNAGVVLNDRLLDTLAHPVSLGVILGLFLGKQIGVTAFAWIAIKTGLAGMPEGVNWKQIYGVSCLSGIGFTMSIFISELAFSDPGMIATAKTGILFVSLAAGIWGFLVLKNGLQNSGGEKP